MSWTVTLYLSLLFLLLNLATMVLLPSRHGMQKITIVFIQALVFAAIWHFAANKIIPQPTPAPPLTARERAALLANKTYGLVKDTSYDLITKTKAVTNAVQNKVSPYVQSATEWAENTAAPAVKDTTVNYGVPAAQIARDWTVNSALPAVGRGLETGAEWTVNSALPAVGRGLETGADWTLNSAIPAVQSGLNWAYNAYQNSNAGNVYTLDNQNKTSTY